MGIYSQFVFFQAHKELNTNSITKKKNPDKQKKNPQPFQSKRQQKLKEYGCRDINALEKGKVKLNNFKCKYYFLERYIQLITENNPPTTYSLLIES